MSGLKQTGQFFAAIALVCVLFLTACTGGDSPTGTGTDTGTGTTTITNTNTGTSFTVNDPLFSDQWHLKNTGQKGTNGVAGTAGEDINVMSVWNTFRGIGIRIAVVDDGVDIHHEDIAGNVPSGAGHNYCSGGTDPTTCNPGNGCNPGGDGCHGTSVAGLAAAASNGVGGLGVAPESSIVGYNLLQNETAVNEADAMTRDIANNQIYTNSWGATDGTGINFPASSTWLSAIDVGTSTGRNNKGAIYTWAAGNGGGGGACGKDNSNYDGQANYHGVFAITALDDTGKQATYSENGANLLIGSYGGEFCYSYQSGHLAHALTTTDMTGSSGANDGGYNSEFNTSDYSNGNYTKCMNGTSGAAPIAAGGIALVLQANPNLTWRDTRIILAQSARKNDPYDADWHTNGAGLHVNHKYGYGVLDVDAAVTKAKTWTNVGATATPFSQTTSPNLAIPDAGSAITSSISVSNSGLTAVEFVDVIVTTNHPSAGDLKITLTSPQGTSSTLSETHACYGLDSSNSCSYSAGPCGCIDGSASCASGAQWSFGVARLINEQPNGNWTLSVQDGISGNTGTLKSWTLTIYGR